MVRSWSTMLIHFWGASGDEVIFPPPICEASWPEPSILSVLMARMRSLPPSASAAAVTIFISGDGAWPDTLTPAHATTSSRTFRMAGIVTLPPAMQLVFEQIRTGGDRNFGYLLGDREAGQAVLIDPSYTPEVLVQRAAEQGLTVTHIINTHGHPDHINGNEQAVALTKAPVAAHPDVPTRVDVRLGGGDTLRVGAFDLQFFYTPGHAVDHLVIFEPSYRLLITGDLLFVGKVEIGRASCRDRV